MPPPDDKSKPAKAEGKIHVIEQGEVPPFGPDQLQAFTLRDESGVLRWKRSGIEKKRGPRSPQERVRALAEKKLRLGDPGVKQLFFADTLIRQLKLKSKNSRVVAGYFRDLWQKYVVIPRRQRRRRRSP